LCRQLNCLDTNWEEISTQKIVMKSIAVLSVALMVVCLVPSTFAAQDDSQKHNMHVMMHEKMNTGESASFFRDNATFETQQERMLEQLNDTISKIESDIENIDELDNENITEEMLTTALTQLEEAKTLITNAEDEDDLKEARELIQSTMEELGIQPQKGYGMGQRSMEGQGMFQGNESFETQQERMLEEIESMISKLESDTENIEELDNENITVEMLDNATTQLEEAKTLVESAEDEEDMKEAMELVHTAMEALGMGPGKMGRHEALPEDETFEIQQERILEQVNNTISKTESDIENIDELDNENITEEMLTTALTQLEEAKTLITNAEDKEDLKEVMEQIHSAMEELGIVPENERGMERGPIGKTGMSQGNESSES
jgi:molecular chaperone GrpE (heat shock protein)